MENRQSIITKVKNAVDTQFGGDYQKFFNFYDKDKNGLINYGELEGLLADVGAGVSFTRWYIAREIMTALDHNGDGFIAWPEFNAVLNPVSDSSLEKTAEPANSNPNDPANRSFPLSGPKEALRPTEENTATGTDIKALTSNVPAGTPTVGTPPATFAGTGTLPQTQTPGTVTTTPATTGPQQP